MILYIILGIILVILLLIFIVILPLTLKWPLSYVKEKYENTELIFLWGKNNDKPECDSTTVWSKKIPCEISFFKELFNNVKLRTKDSLPSNIDILVYSSNDGYGHSAKEIQEIVNKHKPKVLVHASDEWGTRPEHNEIKNVPLILRQYWFNKYPNPSHIKQIIVGYHCWDKEILPTLPITDRKVAWSYIGTPKGERKKYCNILNTSFPNCKFGKTKKEENSEIYQQSIFVFCPKGNVSFNCNRSITACRNGCIPILVIGEDDFAEQFGNINPIPPWIYEPTIEKLVERVKKLLKNPKKLQELSNEQLKWYEDHKKYIKDLILK